MYQFWLNTADTEVDRFLKYFTLLSLDDLEDLRQARTRAPEKREAQRVLAREVTALIHGEEAVREAQDIAEALFSGAVASLSPAKLDEAIRSAPRTELPMATGVAVPLVDMLLATGLASSKRAAHELITSGAVEFNGERVKDPSKAVSRDAPSMAVPDPPEGQEDLPCGGRLGARRRGEPSAEPSKGLTGVPPSV